MSSRADDSLCEEALTLGNWVFACGRPKNTRHIWHRETCSEGASRWSMEWKAERDR